MITTQKMLSIMRKGITKYKMIKNGDKIKIDINNRTLDLLVSDEELEERKKNLREMDKDALCELLLDREAEIEFLKKLEALDRERDRRQAMRRK